MIKKFKKFNENNINNDSNIYVFKGKFFTNDKILFYINGEPYIYYGMTPNCVYYNRDFDINDNELIKDENKIDIKTYYKEHKDIVLILYSCSYNVDYYEVENLLPIRTYLKLHLPTIQQDYKLKNLKKKYNI